MTIEGISQVNSGNENAYQFNGMEKEDGFEMDISMTFFRTYDPTIARWLQVDPLGEMAQNYNPYNFSFNNPIAYADPLGDFPNPIKKIKNFLARCKVKCANLSKKSKRKRVKRGQKGGRKRKKSSKKSQNSSGRTDTRYTGKWQPLYSWSSSTTGGTAGTLRTRIPELRNQVNLPTTTHNIPNPILDTDNPIRTSVRTIPPIYFSSFGAFLNRWNATVNRGGANINIYPNGADPGEAVLVTPVLTPGDINFLNGGGNLNELNLQNRIRRLELRMIVEEYRTFRITYRGVWPFRQRTLTPLSSRHPESN